VIGQQQGGHGGADAISALPPPGYQIRSADRFVPVSWTHGRGQERNSAKPLAAQMFDSDDAMVRFRHERITWRSTLLEPPDRRALPGYVGTKRVASFHRSRAPPALCGDPVSIEVEKAHPDVFNVLLQVLRMTVRVTTPGPHGGFSPTRADPHSNIGSAFVLDLAVIRPPWRDGERVKRGPARFTSGGSSSTAWMNRSSFHSLRPMNCARSLLLQVERLRSAPRKGASWA